MAVWRGPDGILVEVIVLGRRPCLRVSKVVRGHRYHEAYCSLAELPQHVDLADLCEVIELPSGRAEDRARSHVNR